MSEQLDGTVPEEVRGGRVDDPRLVTTELLCQWPLPSPQGSKYSRGQVLVVGGAAATPGAAMLAGRAALRVGAGRLSLAVSAQVAPHVAVALPESGVTALACDQQGAITGEGAAQALERELGRCQAVLVGPGLDDPEGAQRLVQAVVEQAPEDVPVLLDAFGATVLPDLDEELVARLAGRLVLTPNTRELARLLGVDEVDDEQLPASTLECAARYRAAVACSGWVAWQGALWRMTSGDSGLGTSGSGDVSAGAVTGLLTRGATPVQALLWGIHLHAEAGESLYSTHGRVGYLATEVADALPSTMTRLGGV